jgi:hypothetical protein
MPIFWRSDGDYPCVGQQISRRENNARRLSPSDLRTKSGHSQAHIARTIGVDPSTTSRRLVRNTGARGYHFKQAHEKPSQRRKEASDKPRKMTPDLVALVEEKRKSSGVLIRLAAVWRRIASLVRTPCRPRRWRRPRCGHSLCRSPRGAYAILRPRIVLVLVPPLCGARSPRPSSEAEAVQPVGDVIVDVDEHVPAASHKEMLALGAVSTHV